MQQFTRLQLVLSYWGIAKHLGRNLVCQTDIRDPQSAWNTAEGDSLQGYLGFLVFSVKSNLTAMLTQAI